MIIRGYPIISVHENPNGYKRTMDELIKTVERCNNQVGAIYNKPSLRPNGEPLNRKVIIGSFGNVRLNKQSIVVDLYLHLDNFDYRYIVAEGNGRICEGYVKDYEILNLYNHWHTGCILSPDIRYLKLKKAYDSLKVTHNKMLDNLRKERLECVKYHTSQHSNLTKEVKR